MRLTFVMNCRFSATSRAGLNEFEAMGKVVTAMTPKRLAQLHSNVHADQKKTFQMSF